MNDLVRQAMLSVVLGCATFACTAMSPEGEYPAICAAYEFSAARCQAVVEFAEQNAIPPVSPAEVAGVRFLSFDRGIHDRPNGMIPAFYVIARVELTLTDGGRTIVDVTCGRTVGEGMTVRCGGNG